MEQVASRRADIERTVEDMVKAIIDVEVYAVETDRRTIGDVGPHAFDIVSGSHALRTGIGVVERDERAKRAGAVDELASVTGTGNRRRDDIGRHSEDLVFDLIAPIVDRRREPACLKDRADAVTERLSGPTAGLPNVSIDLKTLPEAAMP